MNVRNRSLVSVVAALVLCLVFVVPAFADCGGIFINEVDYDQDGTDTTEFVELKGPPSQDLSTLQIRFVNGAGGAVYLTQALTGSSMPGDGYFVFGNAAVTNVDLTFANNTLQNGAPDGVGLWDTVAGAYCDFVNYEGKVTGFEAWPDIGTDIDPTPPSPEISLARRTDGSWTTTTTITPGAANLSPTAITLRTLDARAAPLSPLAVALPALGLVAAGGVVAYRRRRA